MTGGINFLSTIVLVLSIPLGILWSVSSKQQHCCWLTSYATNLKANSQWRFTEDGSKITLDNMWSFLFFIPFNESWHLETYTPSIDKISRLCTPTRFIKMNTFLFMSADDWRKNIMPIVYSLKYSLTDVALNPITEVAKTFVKVLQEAAGWEKNAVMYTNTPQECRNALTLSSHLAWMCPSGKTRIRTINTVRTWQ